MPGLRVHRSNRVEILARLLAAELKVPLEDPFQAELLVVQSLGMRRWLTFQLAAAEGIAMNCDFPFVGEWAQRVFRSAFPEEAGEGEFQREALTWRILAALPELLATESFAPLQQYIGHDPASDLKRLHLAQQIATVFDQYLIYDFARLLTWEAGQGEHWQAQLWRHLVASAQGPSPAKLFAKLERRLKRGQLELPGLPPRMSVFGLASLAPFFLQLLEMVARTSTVTLYLFEPTPKYQGEVDSHELLARWGAAGRAFAREVVEVQSEDGVAAFPPPEPSSLLGRLHADIFHLRIPRTEEAEAQAELDELPPLSASDGSVRVHSCHSPRREVEVLHDQLLELFEKLPGLTPKDVLVTMPDVETHAPWIDAVFGAPENDAARIPYTIADRAARAGSLVFATLLRLLDVPAGRAEASALLEFLEIAPVRERFAVPEGDLATIREWMDRAGVRWGMDAEHRADLGLPAFAQNSWQHGLDRLLLGYALAPAGMELCGSVAPEGGLEGEQAELLGQVAAFIACLQRLRRQVEEPRTISAWREFLHAVLDDFFPAEGVHAAEVLRVRKALAGLEAMAAWHAEPLPFIVLRTHLETLANETESSGGFLAGRVTFCSLKPMRSIPFRVVCMLGMNEGAFPRRETTLSFDLLSQDGVSARRSRREEDRQLFLETLLSAREVFYLSYCGRAARDNAKLPPSLVVSELLEYLGALVPEAATALVIEHPLQAFSPRYFAEAELFSYSAENARAAARRREPPQEPPPFLTAPLPPPAELEPGSTILLEDLVRFWLRPAQWFAERRLGLYLSEEEPGEDCEEMELAGREAWQAAQQLWEAIDGGVPLPAAAAYLEARGDIPAGPAAAPALLELYQQVPRLHRRVQQAELGALLEPERFRIPVGAWELEGVLPETRAGGRCVVCTSAVNAGRWLRAWLDHLVLQVAAPSGWPQSSCLFGYEEGWRLQPVPEAAQILQDLMKMYVEGQTRPLPFFPTSSLSYAQLMRAGKEPSQALGKAMEEGAREAQDATHVLCFGTPEQMYGEEWAELSLRIFEPMLRHREEFA